MKRSSNMMANRVFALAHSPSDISIPERPGSHSLDGLAQGQEEEFRRRLSPAFPPKACSALRSPSRAAGQHSANRVTRPTVFAAPRLSVQEDC
jgi:hypothetical protein